jgi:predicted TIM-barrel fold metal-dependent hydrolase
MIVDTHTHIWESPDQVGPHLADRLRSAFPLPTDRPDASPDSFDLASAPVTYAFVLGMISQQLDIAITAADVARYVARAPHRLLGFAPIDPAADDAADRFDEAVTLGLAGFVVSPVEQDLHPTDDSFVDFLSWCSRVDRPVIIHSGPFIFPQTDSILAQPILLDQAVRQMPDLKLIISRFGDPFTEQTFHMIEKHTNVYADLAGVAARPAQLHRILLDAHERGLTHKLLFGSDFPILSPRQAALNLYAAHGHSVGAAPPVLPREAVRSIIERDTLAVLGIEKPAAITPKNTQG